ncbi:MAG: glycine cleavage system aminomethyltransferase GcvT, partial [Planctomycetales bacterium]
DISHMGRLRFDGPGAVELLNWLVTRDVSKIKTGYVRYSLAVNEAGGVLDDVLVSLFEDGAGTPYYLMVVNASNREKIVARIEERVEQHPLKDSQWSDLTESWSMIAVQGPKALELLQPLVTADLAGMKYYTGFETLIDGRGGIVSRTGYTGEDGFEVILGADAVVELWSKVLDAGESLGVMPAGLGCRDTLRLEAGMPLYGHELTEETNPYQAGLGFAVSLKKPEPFSGRDALARFKDDPDQLVRVGLELEGKRIAREEFPIAADAESLEAPVGRVTSGTFSPTLEKSLAMGYVSPKHAAVGTDVVIDIRGRPVPAKVVQLPFYSRKE